MGAFTEIPVHLTIEDYEARKLRLLPGDVVVVNVPGTRIPQEIAERVQKIAEDVFPDNKVLVLANGIDLTIVTPDEVEPDPGPLKVGDTS